MSEEIVEVRTQRISQLPITESISDKDSLVANVGGVTKTVKKKHLLNEVNARLDIIIQDVENAENDRKDAEALMVAEIEEINSSLDNKANLNTVFNMANMGQDIKTAMTGGSVAVVGIDSVLTENIVDNQITPSKIKEVDEICWKEVFRFATLQADKIYSSGNVVTKAGVYASNLVRINPGSTLTVNSAIASSDARLSLFDVNKEHIQQYSFNNINQIPSNAYYIGASIPLDYLNTFKAYCSTGVEKTTIPWLDSSSSGVTINKKGMIFGDSLFGNNGRVYDYPTAPYNPTENGTLCKGYVQIMEEELGVTLVNRAVGGWGTPQAWNATSHPYCIQNLVASDLTDIDFVVLSFATNDAKSGESYGELGKTTDTIFATNTFLGAYRNCINHILTLKPTVKIILWTSIPRDYLPGQSGHFGIDTPNINGKTLIDFNNGVRDLAQLYSFPVVDMFLNSNLNTFNIPIYTFEGVHLTNAGYQFVKPYMLNAMRLYLS